MTTQPNRYVLSLNADPMKNHLKPTFRSSTAQLQSFIAGRATFVGPAAEDPGFAFIDIQDQSLLADLQDVDFIESEGGSKIIGRNVHFHENDYGSPGLTD